MKPILICALGILPTLVAAVGYEYNPNPGYNEAIREDPLGYDPKLEVVHLFNNQWPTGVAVSSTGRKFASFPSGLDPANANDGRNGKYQVAELIGDTEKPYPNVQYNSPPGGVIDYSQNPPVTKNYQNYFISVNALYMDIHDNMYCLDTGRTRTSSFIILPATGGTKLVVISLRDNTVKRTYLFPPTVAKPESYFADVRVDLSHRAAYISDAANNGDNAIVVLDLTSGRSRRVLEQDPSVVSQPNVLPFVWGDPQYDNFRNASGSYADFISFGVAGLTFSNDSEILYYSREGGRNLYSIAIDLILDPNASPSLVSSSVNDLGEKGEAIGIACDSAGIVWAGCAENDGISAYDPTTQYVTLYIRDKRINWVYSFGAATDGYMYLMVNQLNYYPGIYRGQGPLFQDARQKPYVMFRFKLPNGATKRA